jgi:hypothetical protein
MVVTISVSVVKSSSHSACAPSVHSAKLCDGLNQALILTKFCVQAQEGARERSACCSARMEIERQPHYQSARPQTRSHVCQSFATMFAMLFSQTVDQP